MGIGIGISKPCLSWTPASWSSAHPVVSFAVTGGEERSEDLSICCGVPERWQRLPELPELGGHRLKAKTWMVIITKKNIVFSPKKRWHIGSVLEEKKAKRSRNIEWNPPLSSSAAFQLKGSRLCSKSWRWRYAFGDSFPGRKFAEICITAASDRSRNST